MKIKPLLFLFLTINACNELKAEDGYDLWMRYTPIENQAIKENYSKQLQSIAIINKGQTMDLIQNELKTSILGLLNFTPSFLTATKSSDLIIDTNIKNDQIKNLKEDFLTVGKKGYLIRTVESGTKLMANTDIGLLYGTYHFLRLLQTLEGKIDTERYNHVRMLLNIHEKEAIWWKDASLLYFQTFSHQDFPKSIETPKNSLEYYKSLSFPFSSGIRPRW